MGDLYLDSEDAFPPLSKGRWLQSLPRRKCMSSSDFFFFFLENANLQEECFLTVMLLMQHLSSFHEGSFIHLEVAWAVRRKWCWLLQNSVLGCCFFPTKGDDRHNIRLSSNMLHFDSGFGCCLLLPNVRGAAQGMYSKSKICIEC